MDMSSGASMAMSMASMTMGMSSSMSSAMPMSSMGSSSMPSHTSMAMSSPTTSSMMSSMASMAMSTLTSMAMTPTSSMGILMDSSMSPSMPAMAMPSGANLGGVNTTSGYNLTEMDMTPSEMLAMSYSRISPTTFRVTMFTFLGIAVVLATLRTALRFKFLKKLAIDDYLLILSVVLLATTTGLVSQGMFLMYMEISAVINPEDVGPHFIEDMLQSEKLDSAASVTVWLSIYCIKFSFLFFFYPLISRVKRMKIWWYFVLVVCACFACTSFGVAFLMCRNYTITFLETCTFATFVYNEHIYLITTAILDIISDLLIISVPVILLIPVKIPLRKKAQLYFALCLSAFMVIITIIRAATYIVPGTESSDTPWIFFWQIIEASVAIIVVSVTAFRSIFGLAAAAREQKRSNGESGKRASTMFEKDGMPLSELSSSPQGSPRMVVRPKNWRRVNSFAKYGVTSLVTEDFSDEDENSSHAANESTNTSVHVTEPHMQRSPSALGHTRRANGNNNMHGQGQIVVTTEFTTTVESAERTWDRDRERRVSDMV